MSPELSQQETSSFSKKRKPHKGHLSGSCKVAGSSSLGHWLSSGISDGNAQGPNSSERILYTLHPNPLVVSHRTGSEQLSHGATLISRPHPQLSLEMPQSLH